MADTKEGSGGRGRAGSFLRLPSRGLFHWEGPMGKVGLLVCVRAHVCVCVCVWLVRVYDYELDGHTKD